MPALDPKAKSLCDRMGKMDVLLGYILKQ
jgi:hypothetical protein